MSPQGSGSRFQLLTCALVPTTMIGASGAARARPKRIPQFSSLAQFITVFLTKVNKAFLSCVKALQLRKKSVLENTRQISDAFIKRCDCQAIKYN